MRLEPAFRLLRCCLLLALLAAPFARAVEVPTRLDVRIPPGSNNVGAPGLYVCTGSGGGLSCGTSPGVLTDDAFIERIDFGSVRFDFADGEIAAGLISVVVGGTDVNAEFGDDDDGSDGNPDPFEKSGNPVPPGTEAEQTAFRETGDPAIRDGAIARALGDASISEGIDGESNNFTLRLDFQAAVTDDDPGPDSSPEILFFERGINSDTALQLIYEDANGNEAFTDEIRVNRGELVDSGLDLDTVEIGGSQNLGLIGVDISDFTGAGFDPATAPIIGLLFGSAGGGADYFGVFALSGALRRDFGDAPDGAAGTGPGNYSTRQSDLGPRHLLPIPPTVYLGTTVPDAEDGTGANATATLDDVTGVDDEDGITRAGQPIEGEQLATGVSETLTATLNGTGYLNVWLDLNADGDFDDTIGGQSEQILDDSDQTASSAQRTVDFAVPVPAAATLGETFLRVRFCSFSGDCDAPTGTSLSGEVEDHRVELVGVDFGDAPDGAIGTARGDYATTRADDGPAHVLRDGSPRLGTVGPGGDDGTQQNEAADADGAEEDGLSLRGAPIADQSLGAGLTEEIGIEITGAGYLNVWLDLDRDGDFDDTVGGVSEHIVVDEQQTDSTATRTLLRSVTIPATVSAGRSYFRARICSEAATCATPTGTAGDGEVEDHGVFFLSDDYGDAPDDGIGTGVGEYETILASNGPRHAIADGLFIGAVAPDADPGVLRDVAATADDDAGVADEGDLVFPALLAVASDYLLDVPVTNSIGVDATLYGWIDFDQSGSFDEDEVATVLVPTGTAGGPVQLAFTLPADVASGGSYARFRLTTDALTASGGGVDERSLGPAIDGEVEDHAVTILDTTFDFGDAPDVYATLLASGGARHGVVPDLRLGTSTDSESDGVPGILAEGDDTADTADEDGIRNFPALSSSNTAYLVDVRVRNTTGVPATLVVWIDFDQSGTFDADEAAVDTVPDGAVGTRSLSWTNIGGAGGPDIVAGRTYARVRITTAGMTAADPAGQFADGEVEDYDLVIFDTESCDIGPATTVPISPLDFSAPTLESGPDGAVGAVYRYDDVTPGVDALVEITDIVNVTLIDPDYTAIGFVDAFQPWYDLNTQPGEGYSEYVITLVKADTSQVVEPAPAFLASTIDNDGDNDDLREFVEYYKPFGTVYRETPTRLSIEDRGTFFRFEAQTSDGVASTDPTATQNIATLRYEATAQFIYRAGAINADGGSGTRVAVLRFDCIEFNDPQISTVDVDFGDAPEEYPTLLNDFGALHTIVGGLGLGPVVDAELEGRPSVEADGDDLDGTTDDEDAVLVNGNDPATERVTPNQAISFTVTTRGAANLSAWVDWNRNGSWADAGEQILADRASTGGAEVINVTVPATAVAGTTYARFRYTTDPGIAFDGGATDGEVEDHVLIIADADYGDAPDGGPGTSRDDYSTLQTTGGPSHGLVATPTVYLGAVPPDGDTGLAQSIAADADDADDVDDEDGALLAGDPLDDKTLFRGRDYQIAVTINGGGYLNAWLDLNRDGDFDDVIGGVDEHVLADADNLANVGAGSVVVPVTIPGPAVVGDSYFRLRYCSAPASCASPVGAAADGEVEDYRVVLAPLTDDGLIAGVVFEDNGLGGGVAHDGLVDGTEVGLGGVEVLLLFDADGDGSCDGSEVVLAQDVTDGDGNYALRPAPEDENKAACVLASTQAGYRSISERDGSGAAVVGDPFDDLVTLLTPGPGEVLESINFGDIRIPRLTPDRQDSVTPGGSITYRHVYAATTDASVDFALGAVTENPVDVGWTDVLYRDLGCDGDLDAADATADLLGVATVADTEYCLLVRTFAPADLPPDALHAREISALSSFTGTAATSSSLVTDITTVLAAQLRLLKSVRNLGPDGVEDTPDDGDLQPETFNVASPGDVLRYRVRFRNEGDLPLRSLQITDATPAFTALAVAADCPAPLTLPDALTGCAVQTPDGSNDAGYRGGVRWIFTSLLAPGAEGSVIFEVRIDE